MKSFQTILLIVFGGFIILAVMIFSGVFGGGSSGGKGDVGGPVTMWGTIPKEVVDDVVLQAANAGDKFDITYEEKSLDTIESDLINALASGDGPDLVLAPHTLLVKQADKFLPLPFTSITERQYKDSFVQSSEVLLDVDHSIALPLFLNPLVMYWNRDLFTKAEVPTPPANWLLVQLLPSKMTKVDDKGKIYEAAVAMGGTSNVSHYKEILSAQIMQTSNPIVRRKLFTAADKKQVLVPEVTLSSEEGAASALRYYAEFGNPSLPKYSWNSAKGNSMDEFIAGKLAVYFGLASEEGTIKQRNPHLNYDIANIPQISDGSTKLTYSDVYALAVLKSSKGTQGAFAVAYKLAFGNSAKIVSESLRLPPARRDLLSGIAPDASMATFYSAAIIARNWYDIDRVTTTNIFRSMVEDVIIGKSSAETAVAGADTRLRDLFK